MDPGDVAAATAGIAKAVRTATVAPAPSVHEAGPAPIARPPQPLQAAQHAVSPAQHVTEPAALDDRAANQILGVFAEIYSDGDLGRLQKLLAADARSARGGRDSLVSEYSRLFATSERRSLAVSNVSWLGNGDTATIIASFEASVWARRGKTPRRSRGDLRLDLRRDQGQWRVYRLLHEERHG